MLQSNKNIITLLASLFILFSCSDEELLYRDQQVEEGIPVTATLSFGASNTVKVETKASDISDKNPVNSLAILVFKSDGTKINETKFCTTEEIKSKSIKVPTTSGRRLVYAVANYKSSLFDVEKDLREITKLKDLKNLAVKLSGNNISVLDNQFLMSGWFVGNTTDEEGLCIIGTDGTIKNTQGAGYIGKIDLKRIMASVKFTVSYAGKNNAKFVADSWQVKNVPQQSYLIENAKAEESYPGSKTDYFSSKLNANFEIDKNNYSFSFLMLENRKKPKSTPNTYDEREKMNGTPETFSVANDNSTYVVLKGTYEGTTSETVDGDFSEKYVKASTTYYVHLGDWRGKKYDNFNIFRNNRYTYNVKILSVDKLIVEVVKDEADGSEEVWGADGDMFLSSNQVRTFDAHYETTVISFSKKMINELIKQYGGTKKGFVENFKIIASTPKNNFRTDESDLDWVTYRRNPANTSSFMKYKDFGGDEPLDADAFKSDLYDACEKGLDIESDDSIRYTCFINEYYYEGLPLRSFINQEPRTIQIWTYYKSNDTESSTSSVSKAAYTFSQRPICTIYDLDKLDNNNKINGWGTEWTQEGGDLRTAITQSNNLNSFNDFDATNNDLLQGRTNMITQLGKNLKWDSYVDYTTNNLKEKYKYAEYACLNRNRDLNGNGTLDPEEIRWYLPAINQYMGFSMGDNVLPKEVRLFTGNAYDKKFIFTSNTVVNKSTISGGYDIDFDTQVFWACEGSSIGYFRDAGNFTNPYRCIRNLRSVTDPVDDFVVPSDKTLPEPPIGDYKGGEYFIYLDYTYLNPRAKREQVKQALTPYHKNTDEENRLSDGIEIGEIQKEYIDYGYVLWPTGHKILTLNDAVHTNPCQDLGDGWRLPNQRELTILTSHMVGTVQGQYTFENKSLVSCTMAKYAAPNDPDRVYFSYVYSSKLHNMSMGKGNLTRAYRCVKDR